MLRNRQKGSPVFAFLKAMLNSAGSHHAQSLISAGSVDRGTGDWSFSAEDGNKLLGDKGDDWSSYAKWFLGEDTTAANNTKDRYKYPFGKDGKVYRSALIAIRSRASQQNDETVFNAAGHMIDQIDGTKNYSGRKNLAMHQQAWAKFDCKDMKETDTEYQFSGIATTPTPDRLDDVVEPMGAEYETPLPLLWQHDSEKPIGNVNTVKPTKNGIPVEFTIPKILTPGTLKDRIDEAIQSIKAKLVRGLSIGFAPIEYSYMDTGGIHFIKWAWLELSVVTIPCNEEATIIGIKAYGEKSLAAIGKKRRVSIKVASDMAKKQLPPFRVVKRKKS